MKARGQWGRKPKKITPAKAFERRVMSLPPMPEGERQERIREIGEELGIPEGERSPRYGTF